MKTKITLLIGAVALVTLSFTFATVDNVAEKKIDAIVASDANAPIGGIMADEIVR